MNISVFWLIAFVMSVCGGFFLGLGLRYRQSQYEYHLWKGYVAGGIMAAVMAMLFVTLALPPEGVYDLDEQRYLMAVSLIQFCGLLVSMIGATMLHRLLPARWSGSIGLALVLLSIVPIFFPQIILH